MAEDNTNQNSSSSTSISRSDTPEQRWRQALSTALRGSSIAAGTTTPTPTSTPTAAGAANASDTMSTTGVRRPVRSGLRPRRQRRNYSEIEEESPVEVPMPTLPTVIDLAQQDDNSGANNNVKRHRLDPDSATITVETNDLVDLAKCKTCFEWINPERFFTCTTGCHNYCAECALRISSLTFSSSAPVNCPCCRTNPILFNKSAALKKLFNLIHVECGCVRGGKKYILADYEKHQKTCPLTCIKCPFIACADDDSKTYNRADLLQHIAEKHGGADNGRLDGFERVFHDPYLMTYARLFHNKHRQEMQVSIAVLFKAGNIPTDHHRFIEFSFAGCKHRQWMLNFDASSDITQGISTAIVPLRLVEKFKVKFI